MKKLLIISVFAAAYLLVPTYAKAQQCREIWTNLRGSCVCNGVTYYVYYQACGVLNYPFHCTSAAVQIPCCPGHYILSSEQGDSCNGPRGPVALSGFKGGETIYFRGCNGQYVPVRVAGLVSGD